MAGRRQAIIQTNAGILLICPLGTNFSENQNTKLFIHQTAFENIACEIAILSRGEMSLTLHDLHYSSQMCPHQRYLYYVTGLVQYRADSRFAPSQWETSLQSNAISHWLGASLESALQ